MVKLPKYVQKALRDGLELHRAGLSGDGLVPKTVSEAESGVRGGAWPDEKIKRAAAWFARHKNDRMMMKNPDSWDKPPSYSPAYVAWLLWGDDGNGKGEEFMKKRSMEIKLKEGKMRIMHAMLKDLLDVIGMMDSVDMDALKNILMATHDRYASIAGDGEPESDADYVDVEDAVEEPTVYQRSNLPPAAFFPASFFAGTDGNYDDEGEFRVSKSKLPHHINDVEDPYGNESVDIPRLRNALARFNQVDWSDFPDGTMEKTRVHLERHADGILASRAKECATCREEDLNALSEDIRDFRAGRFSDIIGRLNG